MRLYNSQSCTPMGTARPLAARSTAIRTTTNRTPLSTGPHPPAAKAKPQGLVASFDPFASLEDLAPQSSGETSATEALTPAISKEVGSFSSSSTGVDKNEDAEGAHNQASDLSWASSSTLSTKFTATFFAAPIVSVSQDADEIRRAFFTPWDGTADDAHRSKKNQEPPWPTDSLFPVLSTKAIHNSFTPEETFAPWPTPHDDSFKPLPSPEQLAEKDYKAVRSRLRKVQQSQLSTASSKAQVPSLDAETTRHASTGKLHETIFHENAPKVKTKHPTRSGPSPPATGSSFMDALQREILDFTHGDDDKLRKPNHISNFQPPTKQGRTKLSPESLLQIEEAERHQKQAWNGFPVQPKRSNPQNPAKANKIEEDTSPNTVKPAQQDDPALAKYLKMIKMGLPTGAVKNAMQRDGVNPDLLDGPVSTTTTEQPLVVTKKVKKPDQYRRTRLYWETHAVVRSNTVWAMVNRDPDVKGMRIDEDEFVTLFRTEACAVVPSSRDAVDTSTTAVKIIDAKRANNGGITLARIKLSYEEIAHAVDSMNDTALTQEQITGIIQYLPTAEEKRALIAYLNRDSMEIDALCECEKFMVAMLSVRKAKRKLNALLFMQRFSSGLEELRRDARLLQKACDEIMCSSGLRKMLGIILSLGNRLNTAGFSSKAEASAIALESLTKLNQAKAFDKKTTFLDYVASVVRRNNASLVHFKDELPSVMHAQKVQWEHTLSELLKMETALESVRKLALNYSREASPYVARDVDSATLLSHLSMDPEDEIRVLRMTPIGNFTLDACVSMTAVVEEVESAKVAFNAVLLYFGEEGKNALRPIELFKTLAIFCADFDGAVARVARTRKGADSASQATVSKAATPKFERTIP